MAAAAVVLAIAPGGAIAGQPVQVVGIGRAPARAGGRARALDRAFADAVSKAVGQMLAPAARSGDADVIASKIIPRARLYILSYQVRNETTTEGTVQVRIQATVDRDALHAALAKLGVEAGAAAAPPAAGARPRLVLLLSAMSGGASESTFGDGAGDGGAAGRALVSALRDHGFDVITAPHVSIPVSREAAPDVPVGDAAAEAIAKQVGAGGALVVGVSAAPEGRIRATRLLGATASAAVRVVDAGRGTLVAQGRAAGAGFADNDAGAAAMAAEDAATRALRAVLARVANYWPAPVASDGGILVTIHGAPDWRTVRAVEHQLRATPGIKGVEPRRFDRREAVLSVRTGLGARRVAGSVGATRLPQGSVAAHVAGGGIDVTVLADPTPSTGD